jgi:hypothetical protein
MYCLVSSVNSSSVCSINYINTKEGFKICKNSFVNNAAASVRLYPGISGEFHCATDKLASSASRQTRSLGYI